jgi:hypothetical protein
MNPEVKFTAVALRRTGIQSKLIAAYFRTTSDRIRECKFEATVIREVEACGGWDAFTEKWATLDMQRRVRATAKPKHT